MDTVCPSNDVYQRGVFPPGLTERGGVVLSLAVL